MPSAQRSSLSPAGRCEEALPLTAAFVGIETEAETGAIVYVAILLELSVRCGDHAAAALFNRLARLSTGLDASIFVSYGRGQAAIMRGRNAEAPGATTMLWTCALSPAADLSWR